MSTVTPDLLTPREVIHILRLEERGVQNPRETLRHLRRTRQIAFTRVGRRILFPRAAVYDYIEQHTVEALT
jgi:excisionase family DNA binding protein